MAEWLHSISFLQCIAISCQCLEHLRWKWRQNNYGLSIVQFEWEDSYCFLLRGCSRVHRAWNEFKKLILPSIPMRFAFFPLPPPPPPPPFFFKFWIIWKCSSPQISLLHYGKHHDCSWVLLFWNRISFVNLFKRHWQNTRLVNLAMFVAKHVLLLWLHVCYLMPWSCYRRYCICSVPVEIVHFLLFRCWLFKS